MRTTLKSGSAFASLALLCIASGCSSNDSPPSASESAIAGVPTVTGPGSAAGDNSSNNPNGSAAPNAPGDGNSGPDGSPLGAGPTPDGTAAVGEAVDENLVVDMGDAPAEGGTGADEGTAGQGEADQTPGEQPPAELGECTREFTMPTFDQLQNNPALPDPFTFLDGTRVASQADWICRQKEISLLAQEFIFGPKPTAPDSLQANFTDGALNITVEQNGQTAEFSVPISSPNGGGVVPGILSLGGTTPQGVAVLNIRGALNQFAQAGGGRGTDGDFYRLYPDFQSTGSLMAWAWTGSRIIDALEITEGHNVDTTKLSALGCSRDGKAAATITLFDDRFAMVAAQSPGSGTTSAWRVAEDFYTGDGVGNVQRAGQIFGENTWMGAVFQPFGGQNVTRLPIDQHSVLALAWPRPLIMMEGTNDYWNCPFCSYTTMKYTQQVYEALGTPDRIGFPQPDHTHCAQQGTFAEQYYNTFVDRFLRGDESVDTSGLFTENYEFDAARWQDGDIPAITP